jgi:hypothetical protein
VLCCFISENHKKTDKNTSIFVFIGLVCDFIDFVCEFTIKTTEHTAASYESSDFT